MNAVLLLSLSWSVWSLPTTTDVSPPIQQIDLDLDQLDQRRRLVQERTGVLRQQARDLASQYHALSHGPRGNSKIWEEENSSGPSREYLGSFLKSMIRKNLEDVTQLREMEKDIDAERLWLTAQRETLLTSEKKAANLGIRMEAPTRSRPFQCLDFPAMTDFETTAVAATAPATVAPVLRLDQDFGMRRDQDTSLQWHSNGWWVEAAQARIVSCAPGKIVFVGEIPGRGNVVMIHHGDEVYSVYSNLISVKGLQKGVSVPGLTTIGRSTDRFYFEIRMRGKAVDPRSVLSRSALVRLIGV